MTGSLDADEKQYLQIVGLGLRGVTIASEPGLYSTILGSTKEEAKCFKRCVTYDALPAIRKTDAYTPPQQAARLPIRQPVRDLLLVGKAISRVKGVNKTLAMACTMDAIERTTGLPASSVIY